MNITRKSDTLKMQSENIKRIIPHVNILWTGGFDSSFRMVQLSKHEVTIQPYYLCDNRKSEPNEINAMKAITADIQNHPETKCTILPLLTFNVSDIKPDSSISEAYQRLHKATKIGSQYDWLARFAKTCEGLEICFEKGEATKAYKCIVEIGNLKTVDDGISMYCKIEEEGSDADLYKIFGAFHFPLPLFEITKLETLEEYKKLGFSDTIKKTWFCHHPVNNEPCGTCNPCKSVVDEGLAFRITPAGLKRHAIELKFGKRKWFVLYKKIRRRLAGY